MQTKLLIGGEWLEGSESLAVHDPSNGHRIAQVSAGTAAEASTACDAAAIAQKSWAAMAPRSRAEVLRSCWKTMVLHSDELAELITKEHGKPLDDAKDEVAYAAEFFRWNSEEAVRIHGSIGTAPGGGNKIIIRHPPVGVVIVITPWNFPAAMITRKIAPALAAGNSVVVKPAEDTPLTALRMAELFHHAGIPAGVINVVPSTDPAAWFDAAVQHPAVRMVTFTGSTETGRILLRQASDRILKVGMELGGNAPFIVFKDADIDSAVQGAMIAKMRHSAQACTAANRFFVEAEVAVEFAEKLAAAMGALTVGNGFTQGVNCGPVINAAAVQKIDGLVRAATHAGASAALGGTPIDRPGSFYHPTVLTDVAMDSDITRAEIFGPVAPIIPFSDAETMIASANDTELGLAAYVYTQDLGRGLRVCEQLESGMVGLNRGTMSDPAAPFGGMKQSGLGREGANEGIYEFCETQYIAASW